MEQDKKQVVSIMLKEIEKVIHQAINDNKTGEYTPLDLIIMAVNEIGAIAMQMQNVTDDFDSDDSNNGGDTIQ